MCILITIEIRSVECWLLLFVAVSSQRLLQVIYMSGVVDGMVPKVADPLPETFMRQSLLLVELR
jgi:hypothetical protein